MTDAENALDAHALTERYDWERRNYETAVRRVVDVIVDAIQIGTKEALAREIVYDADRRDEHTYIDQAAALQQVILQAVYNADFRGLTSAAGDVHATAQAMALLDRFKASLPAETREAIEGRETAALQGRIEKAKATIGEIEKRETNNCRAAVAQGGRGVGFYRCSRTGKVEVTVDGRPGYLGKIVAPDDPNAITIRLCAAHAKESRRIHVWTPNAWEERQREMYRAKSARELAAMEARLPRQLEEKTGGETG